MTGSCTFVGNANLDVLVWPVSDLPPAGSDRIVERMTLRVGGAAANAALAFAALGGAPLLVAAVGDDLLGRLIRDELARAGVEGVVDLLPGERTGVSIAFEGPERDRTFLTHRGTLASFDGTLVPDHALERPYVLLSGYFSLPALRGEPAQRLLRRAAASGAARLLDPDIDADGWTPAARAEIGSLLPLVDLFLPNAHEASGLTGLADPAAAAADLQSISGRWVIVKTGSDGCVGAGPDGRRFSVAAEPVESHDTTGAGDAFNAALIHALHSGRDIEAAAAFAVGYATAVIQSPSEERYPSLARRQTDPSRARGRTRAAS